MAGLVYVNGQKAAKSGVKVAADVDVTVREPLRYVSRGGLKLEAALKHFGFPTDDAVCLDVGASTGGFTDCLLQHGAARVYAVDVGHGQLHYRLRQDERVINLERTHIRALSADHIPEAANALVVDVSFISLTTALPLAWPFLAPGGWCVALIKPQFEVGPKLLRKGVVRDEAARGQAVDKVLHAVREHLPGARINGVMESPIHGPKGNVEYLMGLLKTA